MTAAYPGNSALPTEVRERVLATFRQTLDLYNQGSLDDVIVGCDFLLKMDPLFEPAKKLREKAKNPASPVDLQALMALAAPAAPPPAAPALSAPAPAAPADLSEARAAFDARDYQRASDLASAVLRSDMLNEEAQQISEEASSRLEADPFMQQFATKARQQLKAGDAAAARATMEKARSLDPDHPLLAEILAEIDATPPARPFDPFSAFGAPQQEFGSFQPETPGTAGDSFVVDSDSRTPDNRGAAPASDFGFKFEEEQEDGPTITIGHTQPGLYGFAGGTAKEAAEAVSADTFDFSTASVEVSKEDQKKIQDYLTHGDVAYGEQDYQKAIDIWSRVFLIDVTNDQASERIERARLKKIAIDTQIDDLEAEAVIAADKKDRATAKALYQKILQLDPSNAAAMEQLALLDMPAAAAPEPPPRVAPRAPSAPPPPPARPAAHPFDESLFLDEPIGEAAEEILIPPDTGAAVATDDDEEERPVAARPGRAAAATGGRSKMKLLGIAALLVLLAGGFAAWKIVSGGSASEPAGDNTLSRAQALAQRGQLDEAIAMLLAIPPDHPNHDEALALVAELRATKASTAGTIDGRPIAEVFAARIQQGRAAGDASDFAAAKAAFEQAAAIQPLPADAKQLYDRAVEQVRRLETAENLFKSGNFVESITAAESILQDTPNNTNALDLIMRAQFNLGVQALQEERLQDAVARFDRVLAARPDDELARRARELAVRYDGTDRDLLYRIFVKYLKLR